jgi:hypothetical protein
MIETIEYPRELFDLEGFIRKFVQFHDLFTPPKNEIWVPAIMAHFEDHPVFPEEDSKSILCYKKMIERGLLAYFDFHVGVEGQWDNGIDTFAEALVCCVDGSRLHPNLFNIGIGDSFGFVVEQEMNIVRLHPAFYNITSGPLSTITLALKCGPLDEMMTEFANRFFGDRVR